LLDDALRGGRQRTLHPRVVAGAPPDL